MTRKIRAKLGMRGQYCTNIFLKSVSLHSGRTRMPILPLDGAVSIVASATS